MGTRLTLLACAAALIISGCGGSDSGPDPSNDKTAEIINARTYKQRLDRPQAARDRSAAGPGGSPRAVTDPAAPTGTPEYGA